MAVLAGDAAAGRGEVDDPCVVQFFAAGDADEEFGEIAAEFEEV